MSNYQPTEQQVTDAVKALSWNLFEQARSGNKNILVLEGQRGESSGWITLHTFFLKGWDGIDDPKHKEQTIRFTKSLESMNDAFVQLTMSIIRICRECDALTDMNLNTIENPLFFNDDRVLALHQPVGSALMDFARMTDREFSTLVAATVLSVNPEEGDSHGVQ